MDFKILNEQNSEPLQLKNEPFKIFGELIVSRDLNGWNYEVKEYELQNIFEQTFPDENYELSKINKKGFAIGVFEENVIVGLAIFEYNWNKMLYLLDLKVCKKYRRKNVARQLLKKVETIAKKKGYHGLWTIGQNNNLGACLFYLNYGFEIGGLNTMVYEQTSQKGKQDIYFYYNFKKENI
ncbi:GNAT family N-acetyltransferase [Liquorilactobacillus cacaonum]|uniref:Acetyltransferase n=1 Tax=Liquorilactobacillus cacaonum DSM 21116 TaxID=1423729 RepID=A0A0R2CG30_9LACO|nr:GNAT family N-acetyltransferase [Liquorilactobacillus cacaonum]KRM90266.1 acetyltransferase [Liquorilactobacillus cacaonum DSM 21116]